MYGTGDDWDEKVWLFHRDITEHMLKERPGVKVLILSYQATTHPPKTFKKFPANAMVMPSHTYDEALEEWKEYDVPGGFAPYMEQFGMHMFTTYLPSLGCTRTVRGYLRAMWACVYCGPIDAGLALSLRAP